MVHSVKTDLGILARKTFDPSADLLAATTEKQLLRRFKREVETQKMLSEVSDPIALPVFEMSLNSTPAWFTMPLADYSLADRVSEPADELEDDVRALFHLVTELHELDFVHRDLKPENVLFANERWWLADYGIVSVPEGAGTKITSFTRLKSDSYSAPELLHSFSSVGPEADIYSLACILHDIYYRKSNRSPYSTITVEGPMGAVLERATHANPEYRFRTVEQLEAAWASALAIPRSSWMDEDWLQRMVTDFAEMDDDTRGELVNFLISSQCPDGAFYLLSGEVLKGLWKADPDGTSQLVEKYCSWVETTTFDFRFCDTLADRIGALILLTQNTARLWAKVLISHVVMGVGHNRYHAMQVCRNFLAKRTLPKKVDKRLYVEVGFLGQYQESFKALFEDSDPDSLPPHLKRRVFDEA